MMSFFEILEGFLKKLDTIHSKIYWEGEGHKKKYHHAKWEILWQPKDQGGLGITDLHTKKIFLLSKCLFRLPNEDGMRQRVLRNKYFNNKPLIQIQRKTNDSHFWTGLLNVQDEFFKWGSIRVNDGSQTRFWKDT